MARASVLISGSAVAVCGPMAMVTVQGRPLPAGIGRRGPSSAASSRVRAALVSV
jgi:hypothetical protein